MIGISLVVMRLAKGRVILPIDSREQTVKEWRALMALAGMCHLCRQV